MLGLGVAVPGGFRPPLDRLGAVEGDAAAFVVHDTDVELGARVAGVGERAPGLEGAGEVAPLVGAPAGLEVGPGGGRVQAH